MKKLFELGQVVATPGALKALDEAGQSPSEFLNRHATGDWGTINQADIGLNEFAIKEGARILSVYHTTEAVKLWVITEADRSATTILLPEDY